MPLKHTLFMKRPTILCVDDDALILQSLKIQIKQYLSRDCFVEIALSAAEAFDCIEELKHGDTQVLILIADWMMPGMRGDEFLIKVHEIYPDIIKIMLTGQAEASAVERAKKYAALKQCIQKPWDSHELIGLLRAEIEQL